MFIDRAKIRVQGGNGGNGVTAFRREKFVPRGGPSGGDGGRGGSVYLESTEHLNTLLKFRYKRQFAAGRGGHGEGSNRHGRDGDECDECGDGVDVRCRMLHVFFHLALILPERRPVAETGHCARGANSFSAQADCASLLATKISTAGGLARGSRGGERLGRGR